MSSSLRILRDRNFRYLFLGQSASAIGDQAVIVALALYVTARTHSATDLGLILAAQSVSLVVLLAFGGVWADRMPRRAIMIGSDAVRCLLHAVVAVLILTGGASVVELIVIETLFGAARAFFQPAYSGLLPQTVDEASQQDAQAMSKTTANLAILVGPALGTVLVLTVGAGVAFALDAASFAVSAGLLLPVRARPRGQVAAGEGGSSVFADLHDGWREVTSRPWVWVTIAAFAMLIFTAYSTWYSLAPGIARDVYGRASVFGVLETVAGAGALIGAVAGLSWRPRRPLVVACLLSLTFVAQSVAFALGVELGVVIVVTLVAGFGFALLEIWWETLLVQHIPPHALSRVSAYDWMGSTALLPLGFAFAGPVAAALGARWVLGGGAVIGGIMLLVCLLPRSTRELRLVASAQQPGGELGVEAGGEAEVAHVDPLVGVVHERRRL
jgi:predicted MFS family arabinose efflux permease